MATFSVYRQVQLNFRSVYLLPLILFWIVSCSFQAESRGILGLGASRCCLSVPGARSIRRLWLSIALRSRTRMFIANVGAARAVFSSSRRNLLAFLVLLGVTSLFFVLSPDVQAGVEVRERAGAAICNVPIRELPFPTWNSWRVPWGWLHRSVRNHP